MHSYVEPADLIELFDRDYLVQATNVSDVAADQIDDSKLQKVCNGANGVAYGYLATRYTDESLKVENLPDGFAQAFKIHCAHIAFGFLDSSEESKAKAQEAKEYFQWMAEADRMNVMGGKDSDPGVSIEEVVGGISFSIKPPTWNGEKVSRIF